MNTNKLTDALAAGLLIRNKWTDTLADGRHAACLLATIAPECGVAKSASACPAGILPAWLAHLVPWMNNQGTDAAWPAMVVAFQAALNRWQGSTPAQWGRRHQLTRAIIVREAMRHTTDATVLDVCEQVASCLEAGQWPDVELRDATRAAATDAYAAAHATAAAAAYAAAHATAADAAYAARAATATAYAHATTAVTAAAYVYARATSVDRMTAAILALP